ncbi:MAG: hypothetical protein ACOYBY_17820 [Dermatophilaceae bacterium]
MATRKWADMTGSQRAYVVVGGVVQLALQIAALRDLKARPADGVRGPKAAWVAASFVNTIGPVAYFAVGINSTFAVPVDCGVR